VPALEAAGYALRNRRGFFDNLGDTQEGLGEILEASFEQVELETVGSMAIFAATNPRT
jgi:hypothetical protein